MKFSLKLRKAVRKLVAMIPPHRRYTKVFEIKFQLTTGKTPLDNAINECYVNAVYDKVEALALDDFFKWAEVKELALDIFFSQASYPSVVELELDMFFQQAAFPKAEQYQLEEFFEDAASIIKIATKECSIEEDTVEQVTIEPYTTMEEEIIMEEAEKSLPACEEASIEEFDKTEPIVLKVEEEAMKEMDYAISRMTRSLSCCMEAEKPIKSGLARARSSVFM
jgi:hypothetical protein